MTALSLSPASISAKVVARQDIEIINADNPNITFLIRDVIVSKSSSSNIEIVNGDWTELATNNAAASINSLAQVNDWQYDIKSIGYTQPNLFVDSAKWHLFDAVKATINVTSMSKDRLPTGRDPENWRNFLNIWTVGEGFLNKTSQVPDNKQPDYIVIFSIQDSYGSRSKLVNHALTGGGVFGGSISTSLNYAALIEARSGDIIWYNEDSNLDGDIRQQEGMSDRLKDLMRDFPLFKENMHKYKVATP
ncbi:hypothetical protein [Sphingorhabdus lutea]|uniref:hypothetical protein n=1 Tax=Sphingorhabdus lutea TaxID=1913578 RepID=UPI000A96EBC5|nr:hypothetical protein [Sphingorhabdus lutea]